VLVVDDDVAIGPQSRISGLNLGADEYLTKPVQPAEIVARIRSFLRIREAMAGRFFCTPVISGQALQEIETRFRNQPWSRQDLLSDDERLVLRLLGSGCAPEEISRRLAHQPLPFPMVCQNIVLKLGLPSQTDRRRYAEQRTAKQN
jgi:DNA-binding NarL/FixJ family response regulator